MLYDLIIVGAGPIGLSCAIEAKRNQLNALVLEKGCLMNSVFYFPPGMRFFSSPELIELGGVPLIPQGDKPTREEYLAYGLRLTDSLQLPVQLDANVTDIQKKGGIFSVRVTGKTRQTLRARYTVITTGYYDNPNLLNVPGEQLPHVRHYYSEGHLFYRRKVCIIGGQNSAVEAALDLYRHGAYVVLVHRGSAFGKGLKYWVKPDIENRIAQKEITAHFRTSVRKITREAVHVERQKRAKVIEADAVFAMTGYRPDVQLLKKAGIRVNPQSLKPEFTASSMETNVPGLYVAGSICSGTEPNKIFIENGKEHAGRLVRHICRQIGNN